MKSFYFLMFAAVIAVYAEACGGGDQQNREALLDKGEKPTGDRHGDRWRFYRLLGLQSSATEDEIHYAYTVKVGDSNDEDLDEIQRAYDVLSDDDKRNIYNFFGEEAVKKYEQNPESFCKHFNKKTISGVRTMSYSFCAKRLVAE